MFSADKFHLKTSEILQGDFQLSALNLLLVFQMNCPGCFASAFPVALQLHKDFSSKGLKLLGLSTAFEDFEFNTLGNTIKWLENGELVGETKKVFAKAGYERFPLSIPF